LNGKTYTTLYAHLRSISVSAGQTVSQGQNIGQTGNSGGSTGPHLHFEVHEGGWNAAKSNSVNPMKFF
ncbi:peptidoglycan DD-metalloendopeptidase family protein, partial [Halomonas sp. MG34]|nr:peptidoglycan DD-metalloendopeptidase family protein [Halomonas sp. MG34]